MNTNLRSTNWFFHSIVRLFKCSNVRHSAALLPIVYCLLSTFSCEAQGDVLKYAHQIVDTLASPSMHGRGYVLKGDSIAADYIKKEFEKIELKPVGKEFYQKFGIAVNTFPNKVEINVDGKKLEGGKDFVVYSSPIAVGKYSVLIADEALVLQKKKYKKFFSQIFDNKILIIDDTGKTTHELQYFPLKNKPKAVIRLRDKLQWSLATNVPDYPFIEVLRTSLSNPNTIEFSIENKFFNDYQSQNVLGFIKGSQYPDSFIVFSAHYDHLGMMGKDVYFPGANDNASGCAMLLALAKYYAKQALPLEGGGGGGLKYSIAFMAFGGEEAGLLGSKYYVENPLFPLKKIKFLVNMDIMGTGDEGIKVVNATEHKKEFNELVKINDEKKLLPNIQPRGKAANSDHYFFEEAGVKTFFIYTLGGIKAYHDIYDRAETLPLTKFEEAFKLLTAFTDYLQK